MLFFGGGGEECIQCIDVFTLFWFQPTFERRDMGNVGNVWFPLFVQMTFHSSTSLHLSDITNEPPSPVLDFPKSTGATRANKKKSIWDVLSCVVKGC